MNSAISPEDALGLCNEDRHFFVVDTGAIVNYTGLNEEYALARLGNCDDFSGPMGFSLAKTMAIQILTKELTSIKSMVDSDWLPFVSPKIGKKAVRDLVNSLKTDKKVKPKIRIKR